MTKLINAVEAKNLQFISLSLDVVGKVITKDKTKTLKNVSDITLKRGKDAYWLTGHGFNAPVESIVHISDNDYKLILTKSGREFSKCLGLKFRLSNSDVYANSETEIIASDEDYFNLVGNRISTLSNNILTMQGKSLTKGRVKELRDELLSLLEK